MVLIIGFGKMGNIYSRYLNEFNIQWDYYDPYVAGGLKSLDNVEMYSHIIISTISEAHYDSYKKVIDLGFEGPIYIDKPVVITGQHLEIFDNENVFCGMTERYNPAVVTLKTLLDPESLVGVRFSRYSTVAANIKIPVLFDLGIHDLDLYLYLLGCAEFPNTYNVFKKSKSYYVMAEQDNILSVFEWSHESHKRERKINVLQKNIVYEVDLIDQTILSYEANSVVKNLYVNKAQPLKEILAAFLSGETNNARLAHEFMFDIMG
jgi:predicted dehydrogenase